MSGESNGWVEHKREVLGRLDEQREDIKGLRGDVSDLIAQVAALNVKAGIWGIAGGILAAIAFRLMAGSQ